MTNHYAGERLRAQDVDNLETNVTVLQTYGTFTVYTPGWRTTGAGADPTIGNGSLVGRYAKVGKNWHVQIRLTWGSTTNGGSGDWEFDVPPGCTPDSTNIEAGAGTAVTLDAGTGYKNDPSMVPLTQSVIRGLGIAAGGYYGATTPQTWAVNDFVIMDLEICSTT